LVSPSASPFASPRPRSSFPCYQASSEADSPITCLGSFVFRCPSPVFQMIESTLVTHTEHAWLDQVFHALFGGFLCGRGAPGRGGPTRPARHGDFSPCFPPRCFFYIRFVIRPLLTGTPFEPALSRARSPSRRPGAPPPTSGAVDTLGSVIAYWYGGATSTAVSQFFRCDLIFSSARTP